MIGKYVLIPNELTADVAAQMECSWGTEQQYGAVVLGASAEAEAALKELLAVLRDKEDDNWPPELIAALAKCRALGLVEE